MSHKEPALCLPYDCGHTTNTPMAIGPLKHTDDLDSIWVCEEAPYHQINAFLRAQETVVSAAVLGFTGQEVVLPCSVRKQEKNITVSQMQWSRLRGNSSEAVLVYQLPDASNVYIPEGPLKGRIRLTSVEDFSAVVREAMPADSGLYTCTLTTFPSGPLQGTTRLLVQGESPAATPHPMGLTVV
ncbi:hypothetical protein NHX12_001971 [Muraenolepis orangiensis]|uniref:Ig-like domain-containing protein n=1 Tax=Muraenolepis orangiensis TaxID=630683 RepID=A0A9Q0E1G4_9TELE|nr:hypothetical protein NHX12_001971 [Muraenolepis orangiensis]